MINAEEIIKKIREHMPVLRGRYKVQSLDLFGSYIDGMPHASSDIDLLVEFSEPVDLFDFMALEHYLGMVLGRRTDLVMKDTLKPRIKDAILKEAVPI